MTTRFMIFFQVLVCAVLLLTAGLATSQELKVGFVNVGQLIGEAPQAISVREALQEEFAPRQREILALQGELKEQQEQIQRDLEVMGPDERRNAENALRRDERELARQQQEFTEDLNLRQNEALRQLQGELLREVQTFATSAGYDLILAEGVVYASPAIDITAQVLEGLKANFASESGS